VTVIEASSVRVQTMADSTLRLTVDIEPRFAQQAFALFGTVGTPIALAGLKAGYAVKSDEPKGPVGPLCLWAVQRCEELKFRDWLGQHALRTVPVDAKGAKEIICNACNIKSRRELDTNEVAAAIFKRKVMQPYSTWLEKQGATA
jgi:hypothetical protein